MTLVTLRVLCYAATGIRRWSHMSLLPEGREWLLLPVNTGFYTFLKNVGFYLTTGSPPIVQVELTSGSLDRQPESQHLSFLLAVRDHVVSSVAASQLRMTMWGPGRLECESKARRG